MARILRGEIRWADLNPVLGREEAGLRPVLILSHAVFHERSGTLMAVALTSHEPRGGFPLNWLLLLTISYSPRLCRFDRRCGFGARREANNVELP